jgi:hypothetical protein
MKLRMSPCVALACCSSAIVVQAYAQTAAGVPHLEKQGTATQLIVDGKPFLVLGAELNNSSASSMEYLRPLWPKIAANLNTVLATVSWELMEPEEGQFDFSLVDGLVRDARAHNCDRAGPGAPPAASVSDRGPAPGLLGPVHLVAR